MTLDEVVDKYVDRFWRIYDELGYESTVKSFKSHSGVSDHVINKMTELLDEITLDGYSIELFDHIQCEMKKGIVFLPLPPKDMLIVERKIKERGYNVNSLHERSDSSARHKT